MEIPFISILFLALFISCNRQETQKSSQENVDKTEANSENNVDEFPSSGNLVKVTSTVMDFQVDEEIPSGWTTFRYYNNSPVTHFLV